VATAYLSLGLSNLVKLEVRGVTNMSPPAAGLFCPVCGATVEWLWVWREPDSERVRLFGPECAGLEGYRSLREEERTRMDEPSFNAWTGQRMLHQVFRKEHS
jgi:hypothetical protein